MSIICLGDSNTYGYDPHSWLGDRYGPRDRWVDLLAERTGRAILNEGMNGRTIPRRVEDFPPDTELLIVMLGTNDLLQGTGVQQITTRMEHFLTGLSLDRSKLLLIAPPPLKAGEWVQSQALIQASCELADSYRALARRLGIPFADGGAWGVSLAYDGVHFTEEGHQAFAQGLYKELRL